MKETIHAIIAALTAYIDRALPASASISLIAHVSAYRLYKRFGFVSTAPRSVGMARGMARRKV